MAVPAGKKPTTCIFLEGFGGAYYHIYPVVADALLDGVKPTVLSARQLLQEAALRDKQAQKYQPFK